MAGWLGGWLAGWLAGWLVFTPLQRGTAGATQGRRAFLPTSRRAFLPTSHRCSLGGGGRRVGRREALDAVDDGCRNRSEHRRAALLG